MEQNRQLKMFICNQRNKIKICTLKQLKDICTYMFTENRNNQTEGKNFEKIIHKKKLEIGKQKLESKMMK